MSNFRATNVFKASVFFLFLMFGLFAPKVFGVNNVAHAGNSGTKFTVNTDSKTKLLYAGGVYAMGFSSSTADGSYHLFFSTSTNGASWSTPTDVFQHGIFSYNYSGSLLNGFFSLEYNSLGGYFGAAIYATGTTEIWYASSANGGSWATSTAVSSGLTLSDPTPRKIFLDYSKQDANLAAIFYNAIGGNNAVSVVKSTNGGTSWSSPSASAFGGGPLVGGAISGTTSSPVYQLGYFDSSNTSTRYFLIYASSTNSGLNWTTSTVASNVDVDSGDHVHFVSFDHMFSFALDGNGVPSFSYILPNQVSVLQMSPSVIIDVTSSIMFAQLNNGVWNSTTSINNIAWGGTTAFDQLPMGLIFSGTYPIISGPGPGFAPAYLYSTSTGVWTPNLNSGTLSYYTSISSAYDSVGQRLARTYVLNDGSLYYDDGAVNLSAPGGNTAPSATTPYPVYSSNVTGLVTVTTTVSDAQGDTIDLHVDYSYNGSTWYQAVIGTVTGVGSFTTSSGHIIGITSTTIGNALTFTWDTKANGILTNVNVLLRLGPADATLNGTEMVSSPFAVNNWSGNLPTVNSDAKTKLLLVNGVYNLGFTSSTADGNYHLYFTTSTSGVAGTWSQPVDVFNYGIFPGFDSNNQNKFTNGLFGMAYNNTNGYFGAAIYATGTANIWYTTSTNGATWSATSTVVSGLHSTNGPFTEMRKLSLDYSSTDNLAAIYFVDNNSGSAEVAYTLNDGSSWVSASVPSQGDFVGGRITGSIASHVFHVGYFVTNASSTDAFSIIYVTSTDATAWTSSTVATNVNLIFNTSSTLNYNDLTTFNLDSNLVPAFTYYLPSSINAAGSPPFDTTSSLIYVKGNGSGGWNSPSTIASGTIHWQIDNVNQKAAYLFFNTTTPVFVGAGTEFSFYGVANTSTSWVGGTIDNSLSQSTNVSAVYNNSVKLLADSYVLSNGTLKFSTTSLDLTVSGGGSLAPTITSIDQITSSSMRLNWSSNHGAETEFLVQAGGDGVHFATVSTTPTSTTHLTIDDALVASIPTTITPSTTYYFQIIASSTGSQAVSSIVSATTLAGNPLVPAAPTGLVVSPITTSTANISWTSHHGDENIFFLEFSLDGGSTFVSTVTTSAASSSFFINDAPSNSPIFVRLSSAVAGVSTSTVVTTTFYLLAADPILLAASNVSTSSVTLTWSTNGNPNGTVYQVDDSLGHTTTTVATTTNLTSLNANSAYTFNVRAQNAGNPSTYSGFVSVVTTTLVQAPTSAAAASVVATTLILNWNANGNGGATIYRVSGNNGFTATTTIAVTKALVGLTPNTAYTFAVDAQSAIDSSTYSAAASASATTSAAVPGTPTATATSTTEIDLTWSANGNPGTTVYDVYNVTAASLVSTTVSTSYHVTGLTTNTSYQFLIRAANIGGGYSASSSNSIATSTWGVPTVTSAEASSVSTSTATFNGSISSVGGVAVTQHGFIYGLTTAYGATTTAGVAGTGAFTGSIDSLTPATPYHYKAYATNVVGTVYGSDVAFVTVSAPTTGSPTTTITSANTATSTINVSSDVTNAVVDLSAVTVTGTLTSTSTLPGALAVGVSTTLGTVQVGIPSGTEITGNASWNGNFVLPTIQLNSSVSNAADSGYTATVSGVIEIGAGDVALSLSKSARILIPGLGVAGQLAGYSRSGVFRKISTTCLADTQTSADSQLAADGDCTINVNFDLVIWTKHFTKFVSYSQTQNSTGGGSGGSSAPAVAPMTATLSINNGAVSTNNRNVTLSLNSPGSILMAISEVADLDSSSYETYQNTKTFTLSIGNGLKTVYVKFRTASGGTIIASASITLTGSINLPTGNVATALPTPVSVSFTFKKNLSFGTVSTDVKQLQMVLKDLGFFTYPQFTTKFGAVTRDAVKAFQKANNIKPVNGSVGPLTRSVLNGLSGASVEASAAPVAAPSSADKTKFVFKKNLVAGNISTDVKQLQMVLKDLGFFTYPQFTTRFGAVTRDAVKVFQKANGITPVSGKLDTKTRTVLNSL